MSGPAPISGRRSGNAQALPNAKTAANPAIPSHRPHRRARLRRAIPSRSRRRGKDEPRTGPPAMKASIAMRLSGGRCLRAALCLFLGLVFCLVIRPAEAQPMLRIDRENASVRGWQIGLSERFGGCVATTRYTDQTTVWLGFTGEDNTAFLAFTNPNWASIEKNKEYTLVFRAATGRNWSGRFAGFEQTADEKGLVGFGLRREFILDLARSAGIQIVFERRPIARLSLSGSLSAIEGVLLCHRQFAFNPKAGEDRQTRLPPSNERPRDGASRRPGMSTGTGFFVSRDGHVLTNHHVVESCTDVSVTRLGAPPVPATVVGRDPVNDLALLATGMTPARVPSFSPRVRVGESVYIYGFPLAGLLATAGNFTIGNISALAGLRDDTRMLQHSAPTQPGNSGGALIDERGNVVGIIVSKLNVLALAQRNMDIAQNVNFAIRAGVATNFLDVNGVAGSERPSEQKLDPATLADQSREFTLQVICNR
ncbi:S1C family serine protease [Phreatobacter stygius]|uniref:Trypsin-like peptidase domain-containing protein n=1 Tax=Phreatobacter stygius TaxID=1940610 RepID=A0A4D7AS24_9HYPH|nr:serine protease [Phreatobacter stygius]QCI63779.1 trypsin-like peptidase domain-containing protein [Phreatobacter stygius]